MVLACLSLRLKKRKTLSAEHINTLKTGMIKMTEHPMCKTLLTRSLLQTQAPPGQGGGRWSRSHSTRGCGVHGGNSIVPHTGQRSNPSPYCSQAPPPGCCTPSALYSYSQCKTWDTKENLKQYLKAEKDFTNKCCWPHITGVYASMSPASLRDKHCQWVRPRPCTPVTSAPTRPSSFPCKQTSIHHNYQQNAHML